MGHHNSIECLQKCNSPKHFIRASRAGYCVNKLVDATEMKSCFVSVWVVLVKMLKCFFTVAINSRMFLMSLFYFFVDLLYHTRMPVCVAECHFISLSKCFERKEKSHSRIKSKQMRKTVANIWFMQLSFIARLKNKQTTTLGEILGQDPSQIKLIVLLVRGAGVFTC